MKLNSDNKDTMPITDAVYNPPRRSGKDHPPRGHRRPMFEGVSADALEALKARLES